MVAAAAAAACAYAVLVAEFGRQSAAHSSEEGLAQKRVRAVPGADVARGEPGSGADEAARTVLSVLAGAAVGVSGQIVVLERAQQLQMLPEKSPRIEKRPRAYVSTRKADGWVAGREAKVGMVGAAGVELGS